MICDCCGNELEEGKARIIKGCSTCKKNCSVHEKCARRFYLWKQNVGKEEFHEDKFCYKTFKFYCVHCLEKSCPFCSKQHNVSEPNSFPVECSEGHWCIASSSCCPIQKFTGATRRASWYCPLHRDPENTNELIAARPPTSEADNISVASCLIIKEKAVSPHKSDLKELEGERKLPAVRWHYSEKHSLNLYQLRKEEFNKFARGKSEDFLSGALSDFRLFIKQCVQKYDGKVTKAMKARNYENKEFLKLVKEVYPPIMVDGELKKQEFTNLLDVDINFPCELTRVFYERILSYNRRGWICDNSFTIFCAFLQEIVLLDSQHEENKFPHIFLDAMIDFAMYPQPYEYLNTVIEDLFEVGYDIDIAKQMLFVHEYRSWFQLRPKHILDSVFEELEKLNEVS